METRFGSSFTYWKRLSGSADMSFMTVSELKIFKKPTGSNVIRAEFKGKDGFEFKYKGLLWFCMNRLPKFGGDDGQWVYDRIIPVHYCRIKYTRREGIFNKAVRPFKTVIKNDYTFHEPVEAIDNNTTLEFFNIMMGKRTGEIGRNDDSMVDAIYEAYVEWYFEQREKQLQERNFFTILQTFWEKCMRR